MGIYFHVLQLAPRKMYDLSAHDVNINVKQQIPMLFKVNVKHKMIQI